MLCIIYIYFDGINILEPWFVIKWEDESDSYTPVPLKHIVTKNPEVGSHVKVKEGRTSKVYDGMVIKKGTACIINVFDGMYFVF